MKKIIAVLLVMVVSISIFAMPTSATTADTVGTEDEYVRTNSRSMVTVADVDELIGELTYAILTGNTAEEAEIRSQMQSFGVNAVSAYEVNTLLGGNANDISPLFSQDDIEFNTVYSDIIINGEEIQIMRIYATPQEGSSMYHSGVTDASYTPGIKAGAINALKTWGEFVIGNNKYVGTYVSLYSVLKNTINGFTANSVVDKLSVKYTYDCIENVVFLYYWNKITNNWSHIGSCSRLGAWVTERIKSITVDNYAALPNGHSVDYYDDIRATNHNNATYCYKYTLTYGPCLELLAKTFSISGAAGADKSEVTLKMLRPAWPANCT